MPLITFILRISLFLLFFILFYSFYSYATYIPPKGNNNIGLGTTYNSTSALTVLNGNVGIGTWVPGNSLDIVNGNIGIGTGNRLVGIGTTSSSLTLRNDTSSIYIGVLAGDKTSAGSLDNTFVGQADGAAITTGNHNTSVGEGNLNQTSNSVGNTAAGNWALRYLNGASSINNIALGQYAGRYQIGGVTTNSASFDSIYIGSNSFPLASGDQNEIVIGMGMTGVPPSYGGLGSNSVIIGNNINQKTQLWGNVGIGSFLPFSPQSTLSINGGVGIGTSATNVAYISTYSAPVGGLIVQGNVGIGTFSAANGNLIINGGGNVGIGSLMPGQVLDLQGTMRMTGFTLSGNGAANGNVLTSSASGVATWQSINGLVGWTANGNDVYETSGGNVGIGTTFTNAGGALTVINGNVGIGTWVPKASLDIKAKLNMSIENGNVGIGTLTPTANLHVQSGNSGITFTPTTGTAAIFESNNSNGTAINLTSPPALAAGNGDLFWFGTPSNESPAQIHFNTDSTWGVYQSASAGANQYVFSSNAAGNIGIGTNAPASLLTLGGHVNANQGKGLAVGINANSSYLRASAADGGMNAQMNVGIGSLYPGQILDVKGTLRATSFILTGNGVSSGNLLESDSNGDGTWTGATMSSNVNSGSLNEVAYYTGATTISGNTNFEFDGANIGIGTTITRAGAALSVMNGDVGIGTWVPSQALDINGNLNLQGKNIYLNGVQRISDSVSSSYTDISPQNGELKLFDGTNSFVIELFDSAGTQETSYYQVGNHLSEIMTVGAGNINLSVEPTGGNVGIGTTILQGGLVMMNGDVGIGTWAPGSALQVKNTFVFSSEYDNGSQGGSFSVNWNNGNKQKVTLTGSTAHSITTMTAPSSGVTNLTFKVVQGSASNTISWPGAVKWLSGESPVLTTTNGQEDLVNCYWDGTDYLCTYLLNYTP